MYSIVKFETEQVQVGEVTREVFVAVVKKDTEEQPFRVVIENITDKESAMKEVNEWIAQREAEDAQVEVEKAKEIEKSKSEELLKSLNEGLS